MIKMQDTFVYENKHFKVIAISDGRVLGIRENGSESVNLPIETLSEKIMYFFELDEGYTCPQ